jgi:hypothetical protein
MWLLGTVFMAIVATQNFFTIYRLLDSQPNPKFAAEVEKLGHDEAHDLLWYLSSELKSPLFSVLEFGAARDWNSGSVAGGEGARNRESKMGNCRNAWHCAVPDADHHAAHGFAWPRTRLCAAHPPPPGMRTFGLLHATYTWSMGLS